MQDHGVHFSAGTGQYAVGCYAVEAGSDLVVALYGGDKPHVGAVAVGIPRPSLADAEKISASVSVFTLTGHKEDDLAREMAGKLAAALNRVTVLTAGFHIDNIAPEGIEILEKNAAAVLEQLLSYFRPGKTGC